MILYGTGLLSNTRGGAQRAGGLVRPRHDIAEPHGRAVQLDRRAVAHRPDNSKTDSRYYF